MESSLSAEPNLRNLLFLSYAYEDQVFAKWLARKLAFYGYGVWIDQIKILGGESWVNEVDVAIKQRSFRVLGLLSKASMAKDNPRKERTLALQIGKQRKINDFLITLNLDGAEPDWTISDISWISFQRSWAEGLRRLLKKLKSLNAPQIHVGNPAIAKSELERGASLVTEKSELLTTNLLPFSEIPSVLRMYDISGLDKDQKKLSRDVWPQYGIDPRRVAAFAPPEGELNHLVKDTGAAWHWPSVDKINGTPTHNILSQLLNRSVHAWLVRAGCRLVGKDGAYYLPNSFRGESIFRFKDVDGKPTYIRVSGTIHIYRPKSPPEVIVHHPAIRFSIRKVDSGEYVLQLRPGVCLFDKSGKPILGRKVGSRAKKVTRSYFNEKWRKRLMAFTELLTQAASEGENSHLTLGQPITLSTDRGLDETKLSSESAPQAEEPAEDKVQIDAEEMEDE